MIERKSIVPLLLAAGARLLKDEKPDELRMTEDEWLTLHEELRLETWRAFLELRHERAEERRKTTYLLREDAYHVLH